MSAVEDILLADSSQEAFAKLAPYDQALFCYRRFEFNHFGRLYRSAIDHRHSTNAGQCGRWEQYMYLGYVSKLRNKFAPDWDACCKLY